MDFDHVLGWLSSLRTCLLRPELYYAIDDFLSHLQIEGVPGELDEVVDAAVKVIELVCTLPDMRVEIMDSIDTYLVERTVTIEISYM